jgi:RNA polymerase sigma factor (sigma-70 family)
MVEDNVSAKADTELLNAKRLCMPIDARELEALLDRYWAPLIASIGGSHLEAEDTVQSAFVKLAAEDPVPSNCAAWLFAVTKRLSINERVSQSKRRSRELLVASQKAKVDGSTGNSGDLELRDLLNTLEECEREVVVARIWGGLSFDQIASAFGDSKATVWRAYQSGISRLRESYKEGEHE